MTDHAFAPARIVATPEIPCCRVPSAFAGGLPPAVDRTCPTSQRAVASKQRDVSDNVPLGHRGASSTFIYAFTLSYYLMINTNFTARARLHHATALFAFYNSPATTSSLPQPLQKTFRQLQTHTSTLQTTLLQSHSP